MEDRVVRGLERRRRAVDHRRPAGAEHAQEPERGSCDGCQDHGTANRPAAPAPVAEVAADGVFELVAEAVEGGRQSVHVSSFRGRAERRRSARETRSRAAAGRTPRREATSE